MEQGFKTARHNCATKPPGESFRFVCFQNLLGRDVLVLNATVHEGRKGSGSILDGGGVLGDGELLHELIQNLEGLRVLGRHCEGGFFELSREKREKGVLFVSSFRRGYLVGSIRLCRNPNV